MPRSSTTCRGARTGSRAAAIRSSVRSSRTGRSPGSRSSGPAVRSDRLARRAFCRTPEGATPITTPASQVRFASTATTATATCSEQRRPPISIATRSSRPSRSPTATRHGHSRSISATRATSIRISACAGTSLSPG